MIKLITVVLIFISTIYSHAGVKRISEIEIDISKPERIYMTSGRSTVLVFPCDISHSILGLDEDIKILIGPDSKKTMTLWVSNPDAQPTNLTVKCSDDYYVFDIIPNRKNHQDYLNIADFYDGRVKKKMQLISSSSRDNRESASRKRSLVLVASSKNAKPRPEKQKKPKTILEILNRKKKPRVLIEKGGF